MDTSTQGQAVFFTRNSTRIPARGFRFSAPSLSNLTSRNTLPLPHVRLSFSVVAAFSPESAGSPQRASPLTLLPDRHHSRS